VLGSARRNRRRSLCGLSTPNRVSVAQRDRRGCRGDRRHDDQSGVSAFHSRDMNAVGFSQELRPNKLRKEKGKRKKEKGKGGELAFDFSLYPFAFARACRSRASDATATRTAHPSTYTFSASMKSTGRFFSSGSASVPCR